MDEEKDRLMAAAEMIRTERRKYNRLLNDIVTGKQTANDNTEDIMRLVGTLEAAYNHCLASIAADADVYCLIKHLSYAIILAGEMDAPDVEALYDILAVVSNGRIEACMACKQDETK